MVGSQLENELILVHVLMALLEALNGALRMSNPNPNPKPNPDPNPNPNQVRLTWITRRQSKPGAA